MLFGLLPPEVNSGRMYSGPGSGPLRAAATAWDQLSDHMYLSASAFRSEISGLTAQWKGPSSAAMADAAGRYAEWMVAAAGQAEITSAQAAAAATAFENAFAATIPPPLVAANRAQLALLVATNFLGVNAPAIAATEILYAEMWAQDAAAMDGYAASASAASVLTTFPAPPDTTHPDGADQGLAVARAASTATGLHSQSLTQLTSVASQSMPGVAAAYSGAGTDPSSVASALSALDGYFTGPLSPFLLYSVGAIPELLAGQCYLLPQAVADATAAPAPAAGALGTGIGQVPVTGANGVWAEVAQADLVGRLSVPPAWAVGAPAGNTAAVVSTAVNPVDSVDPIAMSVADPDAMAGQAAPAALASQERGRLFAGTEMSGLSRRGAVGSAGRGNAEAVPDNVSNIFVISEAQA
jgi:PPE-repeat protein